MSRVNFIQDLSILKMVEDRKKREDDKRAKAIEAERQREFQFQAPTPITQNVNRNTDLKDIFFKKKNQSSSTMSSSNKPNTKSTSAQQPIKKKPTFNIANFKPVNNIPAPVVSVPVSSPQSQQSQTHIEQITTQHITETHSLPLPQSTQQEKQLPSSQPNNEVERKLKNLSMEVEEKGLKQETSNKTRATSHFETIIPKKITTNNEAKTINESENIKVNTVSESLIQKIKSNVSQTTEKTVKTEQISTQKPQDNMNKISEFESKQTEQQDPEVSGEPEKKPRKKAGTTTKKQYEFKKTKEDNLVRQDLRGKWRERFKGGVNSLKMRFTKNGKLKQTYSKKYTENSAQDKQSAFDNIQTTSQRTNDTKSQFYERTQKQNMYMNCLSDGLMVTIDDTDHTTTKSTTHTADTTTAAATASLPSESNPTIPENLYNLIDEYEQNEEFEDIDFTDTSDENLKKVLRIVYKFDDFRSGQLEAIRSIIEKQSTLIVQSTGHGKSLIYQFPTLFVKGMAIVISPLISLMMDQVRKLPKHICGAAYNSVLTWEQKQKIIQLIKDGAVHLLYISPEVLQSDFFYFFKNMPEISYVCIDEAHCVSEWSHNFRTSYLIINDLIQQKLKCEQIVALTATATKQTQLSMTKKLRISKIIRGASVDRPNLKISISRDADKNAAVFKLLNSLPLISKNSIIIYCKYKYQCETLAQFLTYSGITSAAYHSGCEEKRKAQIYDDFMSGSIQVVVATIAFGMGIDKSDIRAVIHMNMPKTVENYVQEAGRAGRDGNVAYCHLFLNDEDFFRECGYVQADALDYPLLKQFFQKMIGAIHNIEDETRTVRKKKGEKPLSLDNIEEETLLKAKNKFCYIELKPTMLEVDSKRESLQTLLMKIEQLQDQVDPIFKVYPVMFKNCSVKFYRENAENVQRGKELVKVILEMSMVTNGCHTFNVCDVCNRMNLDPLDLQRQLKELGKQGINYELKEESLIFQLLRPFSIIESNLILDKVYAEVKSYEQTQLNKIHFLYAIAKMSSYPSVEYMLKNSLFKEGNKVVSMGKYFDQYFEFESSAYVSILENAQIDLAQILPFEPLLSEDRARIIADVSQFLRSEVIEKDANEEQQADLLDKYRNPKVIARIFQGVPSYTFDLKEWKSNRFWDRYYQFKHAELYEVVEQGISDFLFDETALPKRAIKRNS